MSSWRRSQDYVTMAAGVLLFISPFVFGETASTVAAGTAYFLGILLFLSGVVAAAMREARGVELLPAIVAVVTFLSPWVFGFAAVAGIAWSAWVLGLVAFLAAGTLLVISGRRATVS